MSTKWLPLESNPDVLNQCLKDFGVPEKWKLADVISFDEEHVKKVPKPCVAVLLLYPHECSKKDDASKEKQQEVDDVYHIKQTIENSCGTIALIHAIANNENRLKLPPDSVLTQFLDTTRDLPSDHKSTVLERNFDICAIHDASAQEGQTATPNLDDDVDCHFITLVNVNNKLVELDGRKDGPIVHGKTSEDTFVKDAFRVCQDYIQRNPDNLNFTAMALGAK